MPKVKVGRTLLTAILIRAEAANFQHIRALAGTTNQDFSSEIKLPLPTAQVGEPQTNAWLQVFAAFKLTIFV